jgi:hypothetical protein
MQNIYIYIILKSYKKTIITNILPLKSSVINSYNFAENYVNKSLYRVEMVMKQPVGSHKHIDWHSYES